MFFVFMIHHAYSLVIESVLKSPKLSWKVKNLLTWGLTAGLTNLHIAAKSLPVSILHIMPLHNGWVTFYIIKVEKKNNFWGEKMGCVYWGGWGGV